MLARGHWKDTQFYPAEWADEMVYAHKTKAVRYQTPEEYAKVRLTWG